MRIFRKTAATVIIMGMLLASVPAMADSSTVSVSASDGFGISFKNSLGTEVEKPIDEIISGIGSDEQPKKNVSRVITVKSESEELTETDIYIRVSSREKAAVEKFDIEIADSAGNAIVPSEIYVNEVTENTMYVSEYHLGSFNCEMTSETRVYTVIADCSENVGISIVADTPGQNSGVAAKEVNTVKRIGDGTGKIAPGEYRITVGGQLKIVSSDGEVLLFKASGCNDELVQLNNGDRVEYGMMLYMQKSTSQNWDKYRLPLYINSIIRMAPGYYTEFHNGEIRIYDENGALKQSRASAYFKDFDAYILNSGTLLSEEAAVNTEPEEEAVKLERDTIYTVGKEFASGTYEGTGAGIVRVYDSSGYAKTVIKLKKENSSAEGVESYLFKLLENETFVAEGDIEFKAYNNASDN